MFVSKKNVFSDVMKKVTLTDGSGIGIYVKDNRDIDWDNPDELFMWLDGNKLIHDDLTRTMILIGEYMVSDIGFDCSFMDN